ncbi:hypothetical protein PInf_009238 [Phytophthora infestans]|nr:hypothetical protein PInf_009238 [Phytophthora infestans]
MWTHSKPSSGASEEGESVFYAVVDRAIETGLIQDDEKYGSCEESGDEADVNAGYYEEDSGRVSGTGAGGCEGELPGDRREEYECLSSDSDYGQFSDDDYVETVRPQQDDDGSSDDEGPPIMDAAFIESLGGTLSLNQMDKNAPWSLKRGATSSVLEEETSTFRGLVQETTHPIPVLRGKKGSPLDFMFYFLPKSLWKRITTETNRVNRQTVD